LAGERTGELTSAATQGIDALDSYFARYLPTAVLAGLAPILLLAWIGWSDWMSFLILAITVSAVPIFMILLGLEAKRHATQQWAQLSSLAATFYDLLQGMATLRSFGRTRDGRRTLERANEEFRASSMDTLRVAFLSSLALEVLASVGTALVALFLGLRLLDGKVSLSTALAVLVLAPEVYLPFRRAGAEFHASAEGQAAAERILDILDENEPTDTATTARCGDVGAAPDLSSHSIELSGVYMRYPGRTVPVLDGASLVIAPGEHLAVTGESGSGKSTLLSLLLGFVAVERGSFRVGGIEVDTLPAREWRQQIAWVPQHPYLLRGSIADNLRVGDPEAKPQTLLRACELSGLSELIDRLPKGIETPVGEGGLTLSAGERQRIALGRAVLRDAPLVLLDEPTAHLDANREASLQESLSPWLEGRTVVMAAHRGGPLRSSAVNSSRSRAELAFDRERIIAAGTFVVIEGCLADRPPFPGPLLAEHRVGFCRRHEHCGTHGMLGSPHRQGCSPGPSLYPHCPHGGRADLCPESRTAPLRGTARFTRRCTEDSRSPADLGFRRCRAPVSRRTPTVAERRPPVQDHDRRRDTAGPVRSRHRSRGGGGSHVGRLRGSAHDYPAGGWTRARRLPGLRLRLHFKHCLGTPSSARKR
jgi:thiol reductant ABC exporter CydD subunit